MLHDAYFARIEKVLTAQSRAVPVLVIDLERLDHNLALLARSLGHLAFRLVVKSLPCAGLLRYAMERIGSKRLMVFDQPLLSRLPAALGSDIDVLFGKPMPTRTARFLLQRSRCHSFDVASRVAWLCDTHERVDQYIGLARSLGCRLRINLDTQSLHASVRVSVRW